MHVPTIPTPGQTLARAPHSSSQQDASFGAAMAAASRVEGDSLTGEPPVPVPPDLDEEEGAAERVAGWLAVGNPGPPVTPAVDYEGADEPATPSDDTAEVGAPTTGPLFAMDTPAVDEQGSVTSPVGEAKVEVGASLVGVASLPPSLSVEPTPSPVVIPRDVVPSAPEHLPGSSSGHPANAAAGVGVATAIEPLIEGQAALAPPAAVRDSLAPPVERPTPGSGDPELGASPRRIPERGAVTRAGQDGTSAAARVAGTRAAPHAASDVATALDLAAHAAASAASSAAEEVRPGLASGVAVGRDLSHLKLAGLHVVAAMDRGSSVTDTADGPAVELWVERKLLATEDEAPPGAEPKHLKSAHRGSPSPSEPHRIASAAPESAGAARLDGLEQRLQPASTAADVQGRVTDHTTGGGARLHALRTTLLELADRSQTTSASVELDVGGETIGVKVKMRAGKIDVDISGLSPRELVGLRQDLEAALADSRLDFGDLTGEQHGRRDGSEPPDDDELARLNVLGSVSSKASVATSARRTVPSPHEGLWLRG